MVIPLYEAWLCPDPWWSRPGEDDLNQSRLDRRYTVRHVAGAASRREGRDLPRHCPRTMLTARTGDDVVTICNRKKGGPRLPSRPPSQGAGNAPTTIGDGPSGRAFALYLCVSML